RHSGEGRLGRVSTPPDRSSEHSPATPAHPPGTEDVLASADVRPTDPTDSALSRRPSRSSRRSPWDRPRDRVLAAVLAVVCAAAVTVVWLLDRKSTRLNSSHVKSSY